MSLLPSCMSNMCVEVAELGNKALKMPLAAHSVPKLLLQKLLVAVSRRQNVKSKSRRHLLVQRDGPPTEEFDRAHRVLVLLLT